MKEITQNTVKNSTRKLAILVVTLTTGLFTLVTHSSIVQANELIEIEPIKQLSLYQAAQESLALSFTNLSLSQNTNNEIAKNNTVNQERSTSINSIMTLTNVIIESE